MLHPDYKLILKKAWSIRFIALAGLFSTAEAVLPLFADELPRGAFALATAVAIIGALVSRITVQQGLSNGD